MSFATYIYSCIATTALKIWTLSIDSKLSLYHFVFKHNSSPLILGNHLLVVFSYNLFFPECHTNVITLSSSLHSPWWEVFSNSYFCSSVYIASFILSLTSCFHKLGYENTEEYFSFIYSFVHCYLSCLESLYIWGR